MEIAAAAITTPNTFTTRASSDSQVEYFCPIVKIAFSVRPVTAVAHAITKVMMPKVA
jgi:hypothetical protein